MEVRQTSPQLVAIPAAFPAADASSPPERPAVEEEAPPQGRTPPPDRDSPPTHVIDREVTFRMHERSGRVMVQVVDRAKDEVVAEFPPHELLDTLARIREAIGLILDKYA